MASAMRPAFAIGLTLAVLFLGTAPTRAAAEERIEKVIDSEGVAEPEPAHAAGGGGAGADSQDPETFVDALAREALEHRAVRHPYLAALASGALPDLQAALADFASHYYGYSEIGRAHV